MSDETTYTLGTSLEQIVPHLPSVLMAPESLARIQRIAQLFPVSAVDFFGFECRLGTDPSPTDCAMNFTADGARMLAGRSPRSLPQELQSGPWKKIQTFYQEWGDTRQPPYVDAGATWLEFDTSATTTPAPNLLFGYWPQQLDIRRPPDWLVDTIIPLLLGGPISPTFRRNVIRCLEARPAETGDFQVGVMLSRDIQAIRICIFDLPREKVLAYLESIGWKGAREELCTYLDAFRQHADFIGLHLDIGEAIYPHIGIEPGFVAGCWSRQPHREPRWFGQFSQLHELGLLAPEKQEALMNWIGHQNLSFGDKPVLLLRGLSHLKIVLRPGARPIAKAYFGIAHRTLGTPGNGGS